MVDGGGIYTSPLPPNGHLQPHSLKLELKLSLSKLSAPNSVAQDLRDSSRDLALESVRKIEKILLLRSCALGEVFSRLVCSLLLELDS